MRSSAAYFRAIADGSAKLHDELATHAALGSALAAVKGLNPGVPVVAGNVVTADATRDLVHLRAVAHVADFPLAADLPAGAALTVLVTFHLKA